MSFYWVVAHELGHVWGLAHSDSPRSLMYPTQCATCRWSSFEQAAGNLIHAAGLVPDWSRPHYANRFFVKTPRGVIPRLLTGELPDEPLWSSLAEHCAGESCTSTGAPALTEPPSEEDPVPRSSLIGLEALRQLRKADLLALGGPARLGQAERPLRSVPGKAPSLPGGRTRATLIAMAPAPPPGPRWRDAWRVCSPPLS